MTPQLEAVERAIIDVEKEGFDWAAAAALEMTLENAKGPVKDAIVKRLCTFQEPDPDSEHPSRTRPGLSPTAAEKAATLDPEYQAHLEELRKATLQKNRAYTGLISARLRAIFGLLRVANESPAPLAVLVRPDLQALLTEEATDLDLVRAPDERKDLERGGVPR